MNEIFIKPGCSVFLKIIFFRMLIFFCVLVPMSLFASCYEPDNSFYQAVIKDPVIDMNNSFPPPDNPPASPETKRCHRAHQGLYNELVDCIEQQGDCVKVACNNLIYGFDVDTHKALNTFWVYKKQLMPLSELGDKLWSAIPHQCYAYEPTVVLIYPWHSFSLGTRFKRMPEHDTESAYAIVRAEYFEGALIEDLVPHAYAIPEIKQDVQSARRLFVKIINELIDRVAQSEQHHVISYVFGGSSCVQTYTQPDFYQEDGAWQREGKRDPYTGYDCSEFVMRMAQIAGLNFPWKTTAALEQSKRALAYQDILEDGDLIWMPGHVMIVSNIGRNEIIEARGYGSGYGCVHRSTLSEVFDGIVTYDDVLEFYYMNKPIMLKNKQGIPTGPARTFKLLKLTD